MRCIVYTLILLLHATLWAQENIGYCPCEQDVDAYADGLRKIVLTGELQEVQDSVEYLDRIDVVSRDIKRYDMCDISSVECLRHLNRLGKILNIKSIMPQTRLLEKVDTMTRSENSFATSPLKYSSYDGSIDELEAQLSAKEQGDLEGIYHSPGLKVAVVKNELQRDYRFYVIESDYPEVKSGNLVGLATLKFDSTLTTHSLLNFRRDRNYLPLDMFMDGKILKSGLAKKPATDFQQYLPADSLPTFLPMEDDIAYTSFSQNGIKSYDAGGMSSAEIEKGLRDPIYTDIILDMRTWYGHSFSTDAYLLDALEDIKEKKTIYVLVAASTGGAAERLALYLQEEMGAIVLGHPTAGNLDLSKHDENRMEVLPSGRFFFNHEVPPMDNMSSFAFTGVPLDKLLSADADFVDQIMDIILEERKLDLNDAALGEEKMEDREERREERLEEMEERQEEKEAQEEKKNG